MENDKYLGKITSQHKTKPKFVSWLKENLNLVDDITKVLSKVDEDFNIYDAKGKQQDILGEIIGVSRILDFEPVDGSSPILKDDIYRTLQLAKISMNQWDGTIPGVLKLWEILFPQYRLSIRDNQDMSMDLMVIGMTSVLEKELMIRGYIAPKPEGVHINYKFIIETQAKIYIATAFISGEEITVYPYSPKELLSKGNIYIAAGSNTGLENVTIYPRKEVI